MSTGTIIILVIIGCVGAAMLVASIAMIVMASYHSAIEERDDTARRALPRITRKARHD